MPPPTDCQQNCSGAKIRFGLESGVASVAWGLIWESYPSLVEVKDYLDALSDAGRFRIDAFNRPRPLAYTFLCKFRNGTTLYHGTKQDFTNGGAVQILRGGFYTTWLEYARFLLWTAFGDPNNQDDPRNAVLLEYQAPNNEEFFYINSRLFMNALLSDAQGRHGVAANGAYPDNHFSGNRNYGAHAKIFCKSSANYGVPNIAGVIQGVSAMNGELFGMLNPVLSNTNRQQNFTQLCTAVGGQLGQDIQTGYQSATQLNLNVNDLSILADFEEIYWNARPNPTNQQPLPNLPQAHVAINRANEYRNRLIGLLQSNEAGHQYCFDYRTYGPLPLTLNPQGFPHAPSARACLTALCRTRNELHQLNDKLFERLAKECKSGIKKYLYDLVRRLVFQSSAGVLSAREIDILRDNARQLRAQLG